MKTIFDSNNLWFISDTHFNHGNIITFQPQRNRFLTEDDSLNFLYRDKHKNFKVSSESIDNMNKYIIKQWNETVPPEGEVIFLGDFAWNNSKKFRSQLNGKIYFVTGNHDEPALNDPTQWEWIVDFIELKVRLNNDTLQKVFCCHYPMRSWPSSFHGSYHLFGHVHGNLESEPYGRSMDVGFDIHDKPISFNEIDFILSQRQILKV